MGMYLDLDDAAGWAGEAATNELNALRQQLAAAQARIAELEEQVDLQVPMRVLEAQQARIAELREALEWAQQNIDCVEDADERGRCTMRCNEILAKSDNLSALEAVKAQARREALLEAADHFTNYWNVAGSVLRELRRMAEEVKP